MIPVKGSVFENMPLVSNKEVMDLRKKCGEHLKQMYHCKQCRADAIGLLGDDKSLLFSEKEKEKNKVKSDDELKFAVVSKSGMIVDQHFGHATEVYIYKYDNGEIAFIEKRNIKKYCEGIDSCGDTEDKMASILKSVKDCQGVLALRIGDSPANKLKAKGIKVFMTCERVEDAVKAAAEEILSEKKSKYVLKV
jgi:predicted Fe-Mo cluster-binding NifX family protein